MYYLKKSLIIGIFLVVYDVFHSWVGNMDLWDWNPYTGAAMLGIARILCGILLGWVLYDPLELKNGSKGNIFITVFLLILSLGFHIRYSNIYVRFSYIHFLDEILIGLAPFAQFFLGAWLFLLIAAKVKSRRIFRGTDFGRWKIGR